MASQGGSTQAMNSLLLIWPQVSNVFKETFNTVLHLTEIEILATCDTSHSKLFNRECSNEYTVVPKMGKLYCFNRSGC